MPKPKNIYVCQTCGYESRKWLGRCPQCGEWNSLVEEVRETVPSADLKKLGTKKPLYSLADINVSEPSRIQSGISELDRVLGGGLVPGSLVLIAGDPGIGKSTILSQLIANTGGWYVCAEESPEQIKIRFQRLKLKKDDVSFLADNSIDNLIATLDSVTDKQKPKLIVVDSIQTVYTAKIRSSVGSISQIRECTNLLLQLAKSKGISIFIVGHITKEGAIAGPKVLEHLVDCVLYLAGDKNYQYRLLTSAKNRFGPTDEVGIFSMSDRGLTSEHDPSRLFWHQEYKQPGSAHTMTMTGQRPILVEVQALCVRTKLAMPRRVAQGISAAKLQVLAAVLQKHLNLSLYEYDIFVNVAGGLTISEPAIDLAVAAAIYSSVKNKPFFPKTVFFGEVGLLGDLRPVSFGQKRHQEAKKLGFDHIVTAHTTQKWLKQALVNSISEQH